MVTGLQNGLPTDRAGFARSVVDQPTNVDVRLTDVHFTYRGGVRALQSVSLRIDAGEQIALVGQKRMQVVQPTHKLSSSWTEWKSAGLPCISEVGADGLAPGSA
jgi:hypothetical protein